jgi:hypothetical protein
VPKFKSFNVEHAPVLQVLAEAVACGAKFTFCANEHTLISNMANVNPRDLELV